MDTVGIRLEIEALIVATLEMLAWFHARHVGDIFADGAVLLTISIFWTLYGGVLLLVISLLYQRERRGNGGAGPDCPVGDGARVGLELIASDNQGPPGDAPDRRTVGPSREAKASNSCPAHPAAGVGGRAYAASNSLKILDTATAIKTGINHAGTSTGPTGMRIAPRPCRIPPGACPRGR